MIRSCDSAAERRTAVRKLFATIGLVLFVAGAAVVLSGQGKGGGQKVFVTNRANDEWIPVHVLNTPTVALVADAKVQVTNFLATAGTVQVALPSFLKVGMTTRVKFAPAIGFIVGGGPTTGEVESFRILALGSDGWIQLQPDGGGGASWFNIRYIVQIG